MIIRGIFYLPTNQAKVTWASYFPNTQCLTWLLGVAEVSLSSCVLRESCRQHQVSLTRWSIRTLMNKEQAEKLPLFPPLRDTRGIGVGVGPAKGISWLKLLKLGSLFIPEGVTLHLHTEALKEWILNVEFTQWAVEIYKLHINAKIWRNCKVSCGSDETGTTCLIPCPGVRNGKPLQYSWLENSGDTGAWQAEVNDVAKSQTWLND